MVKEVLKVCFKPLTLLNKVIPKNEKLIFFYSNLGFRDNVKAMFDYLIEHGYQKEYRIVCAINEVKKYRNLQKKHPKLLENVRFVSCKKGIWSFLRCKTGFYCFGKYPIKPAKNQTIINLWHGVPLKKIGNMEEKNKDVDYNYFTYVLATSPYYGKIMEKCFNCTKEQILIEGQPRNDELFRPLNEREQKLRAQAEHLIVWMPTYRNTESTGDEKKDAWPVPLVSEEEAGMLDEFLQSMHCRLVIKLHPLQYCGNMGTYQNMELLDQKQMERKYGNLYKLLKISDALITDYSSVYFDYMLLDRPIGFTVDDMEAYEKERGFVVSNPKELMPGMKIRKTKELLRFIEDVVNGWDEYGMQRRSVNELVNTNKDGNSSERIAKRYL